jgi:peptidoglycan LD-endopeptidase LytH
MVPVDGVEPSRVERTFAALRGGRTHGAIDIAARRGTPVLAASDLTIVRVAATPTGGNIIYALDRTEQFMYYYAHLDRFRDGLAAGTKLARGDVVGFVGSSGNASAESPHLHFQVMLRPADAKVLDGTAIDPVPYFVVRGAKR